MSFGLGPGPFRGGRSGGRGTGVKTSDRREAHAVGVAPRQHPDVPCHASCARTPPTRPGPRTCRALWPRRCAERLQFHADRVAAPPSDLDGLQDRRERPRVGDRVRITAALGRIYRFARSFASRRRCGKLRITGQGMPNVASHEAAVPRCGERLPFLTMQATKKLALPVPRAGLDFGYSWPTRAPGRVPWAPTRRRRIR